MAITEGGCKSAVLCSMQERGVDDERGEGEEQEGGAKGSFNFGPSEGKGVTFCSVLQPVRET